MFLFCRYMKVYGLKFSKEDHIALIKLMFDLVTIPDLEPTRVNKFATTLTHLLKYIYYIFGFKQEIYLLINCLFAPGKQISFHRMSLSYHGVHYTNCARGFCPQAKHPQECTNIFHLQRMFQMVQFMLVDCKFLLFLMYGCNDNNN